MSILGTVLGTVANLQINTTLSYPGLNTTVTGQVQQRITIIKIVTIVTFN